MNYALLTWQRVVSSVSRVEHDDWHSNIGWELNCLNEVLQTIKTEN